MTDWDVVEAMRTYGGSFVQALAVCYQRADVENQQRIRAAFPELWTEYQQIAASSRKG